MATLQTLATWTDRTWRVTRFESKLTVALVTTLTAAVLMGLHAYYTAHQAHNLVERSRMAHEVLYSFGKLNRQQATLFQSMTASALGLVTKDRVEEASSRDAILLSEILSTISTIRSAILAEVAFVGNAPDENEQEEFYRLQEIDKLVIWLQQQYSNFAKMKVSSEIEHIRAELSTLLESPQRKLLIELIAAGIRDEQHESAVTDERARTLLNGAENIAILAVFLIVIFGILSLSVLILAVRRPLAALREGMNAFAAGDLEHRIKVDGSDEFAELAKSLNALAHLREVRRKELVLSRTQLERAVKDRTSELVYANERLAGSDAARRRFLADISHELRTPLTIIRGESDIALRGADKTVAEYKSALSRIQEEAAHTAVLVDDLLFLARREAGEIRLQINSVKLGDIVGKTSSEVQPIAAPKRVRIEFDNRLGEARSAVDALRIRQLMLICLDNAIRYSHPDATVQVGISRSDEMACIVIRDFGIGISEVDLPNIFERFYLGTSARHHDFTGTGLGLPMAKAIVEAHDGRILVESKSEQGTTVRIWLPLEVVSRADT